MQSALIVSLMIILLPICAFSIPSFPGAEGWGSQTPGGRGGKVLIVTNLNNDGPGSFKAALRTQEPRIIVFRVSGVVDFKPAGATDWKLDDSLFSYVTIAGQTSPAGITVNVSQRCTEPIMQYTNNRYHDGVWRFLRFRVDSALGDHAFVHYRSHNFIIDHCDFSGGVDETVDFARCHDFTVQWSTITNSSKYAGMIGGCTAASGPQGYGMLCSYKPFYHHSFHHNMMANHHNRGPQYGWGNDTITDSGRVEFCSNVIYNIGLYCTSFRGDSLGQVQLNVMGNYFKSGPLSYMDRGPLYFESGNCHVFLQNNHWESPEKSSANFVPGDPDSVIRAGNPPGLMAGQRWLFPNPVTATPSAVTFDTVLARVGCWPRDSMNYRTIREVRDGTGRLSKMDDPLITEGPAAPADVDNDGMPDFWETAMGFNPGDSTDNLEDHDTDGYTNIEEYINDLALAKVCNDYHNPVYPIPSDWPDYNPSCCGQDVAAERSTAPASRGSGIRAASTFNGTVRFKLAEPDGRLEIFNLAGRKMAVLDAAPEIIWNCASGNGDRLAPGLYLVRQRHQGRTLSCAGIIIGR